MVVLPGSKSISVQRDGTQDLGTCGEEIPGLFHQHPRQPGRQLRSIFVFESMDGAGNWAVVRKGGECPGEGRWTQLAPRADAFEVAGFRAPTAVRLGKALHLFRADLAEVSAGRQHVSASEARRRKCDLQQAFQETGLTPHQNSPCRRIWAGLGKPITSSRVGAMSARMPDLIF